MDTRLKKLITRKPAQISVVRKFQSGRPLHFTEHARFKMRQYGLSEARVKRVLRTPARVEAGIAPRTVAVMQSAQPSPRHSERSASVVKNPVHRSTGSFTAFRMTDQKNRMTKRGSGHEIWIMYQDTPKARKIIAAWRYPGVSPVREPPPFPEDLMN